MKFFYTFAILSLVLSCSTSSRVNEIDPQKYLSNMKACFLLYNLSTNSFEQEVGDSCNTRLPACSTFKVPLAVMAFDSGILKNESQILKWDGKKRMLDNWNKNHSAKTWLRDSVVWFSQRLTPKIGQTKVENYLSGFKYGNADMSTGITSAWLNSPSDDKGALEINAYEQVEFLKNLWTNNLPVSKRAMKLTRNISYLETSPKGFHLSGKTGSNFYDKERKVQLGWFVAHLKNKSSEYIAVTNISDLKPVETIKFGGYRAKEITLSILKDQGLW